MLARPEQRRGAGSGWAGLLLILVGASGCASPGPPRAPSLQLPQPVGDVQATRRGAAVELQFAAPAQTSEGLPYRGGPMRAAVCRAVGQGGCVPVPGLSATVTPLPGPASPSPDDGVVRVRDVLPPELAGGPARLLTYRVQLSNERGRTAGYGDAAYAAAGVAPEPVSGLRAEGTRNGVVVRWGRAAVPGGEVVLRRETAGPGQTNSAAARDAGSSPGAAPAFIRSPGKVSAEVAGGTRGKGRSKPGLPVAERSSADVGPENVVWLRTAAAGDPLDRTGNGMDEPVGAGERSGAAPDGVLDDSAARGAAYRYAAERQRTVNFGGHTLVLHSALSAPVEVFLLRAYAPLPPTDLAATIFRLPAEESGAGTVVKVAVDLIWEPADEPTPTYYHVYRERQQADGSWGSRVRLTEVPVGGAAYHDVLPPAESPAGKLRYSVTAVNQDGMESAPVVATVTPASP